ncbi:MAG: DedA family protein [Terracidiphilus sp.]
MPLPGETVLMFSGFTACKTHRLDLWAIILIGACAAIVGDNCGFCVGRRLGPRLMRWFREKLHKGEDIAVAADLIHRHGGATVFWARYIFGLRTITAPVAGALNMEWKKFLFYNALGAITGVTFIACAGYGFANGFNDLLGYFEKAGWAVTIAVFGVGHFLWRRAKKHYREMQGEGRS